MTITQAVAYKLLNTATVTAYVSNRIWSADSPEAETTLPKINIWMISKPNLNTGAYRPRIQVSVRSKDPEQAWNIVSEVIDTLNDLREQVSTLDIQDSRYDDSRMLSEPDGVYHVPVDIFFLYIEA